MFTNKLKKVMLSLLLVATSTTALAATPLRIAYGNWPGWVTWQIAVEKHWFKEAGVDVQFLWFDDYAASLDAFAAGQLDATSVTNGDALVIGSSGAKSKIVMVNDYSAGNDVVLAKSNIKSIKDLKGKDVSVEKGLVDHLLFLDALKKNGMQPSDVNWVWGQTNDMPQMLKQPNIAAVSAWEPVISQAKLAVPGAHPLFTSNDEPGLIYDVLAVNPTSAYQRRDDWVKVVKIWDKVVNYVQNPATHADAIKIMAKRTGVSPDEFAKMLGGTHLLSLKDGLARYTKGDGFDSLYGSSNIVNQFNVDNEVYPQLENVDSYIDSSWTKAALADESK